MMMLGIVPIFILAGLIPAAIAKRKGGHFLKFWFYGSLLFVFVLPYALAMEPSAEAVAERAERAHRAALARGDTRCLLCRDFMGAGLTICPHCLSQVDPDVAARSGALVQDDAPV
jgi:hypothetical protein